MYLIIIYFTGIKLLVKNSVALLTTKAILQKNCICSSGGINSGGIIKKSEKWTICINEGYRVSSITDMHIRELGMLVGETFQYGQCHHKIVTFASERPIKSLL